MRNHLRILLMALAALLLPAFLTSQPAQAAKACRELDSKAACERRDDCIWVKGYKRKDGVRVDPYCRMKGKNSGKAKDRKSSSTRSDRRKDKTEGKKDKPKKSKKDRKSKKDDKKESAKEKLKKNKKSGKKDDSKKKSSNDKKKPNKKKKKDNK